MKKITLVQYYKRAISLLLSVIIAFGTFLTLMAGNVHLSDWIDLRSALTAKASTTSAVKTYRYKNLVGLYNLDYTDTTTMQYKIGDNGTWKNYTKPFTVSPFATTKVYKRLGTTGAATYSYFEGDNFRMGRYTPAETDLSISNNGVSFGYTRTYNSKDNTWFESTDSRIYLYNDSLARMYLTDGTMIYLPRKSATTYRDEVTKKQIVLDSANGCYVYKDDDYTYKYRIGSSATTFYLWKIEDANGNTITITRGTSRITVSNGLGDSFYIPYITATTSADTLHNFTATDIDGSTITLQAQDNVFYAVLDADGNKIKEYKYTSCYDGVKRLTFNTGKRISYYNTGRIAKITNKDGSYTSYGYNPDEKRMRCTTSNYGSAYTTFNDAMQPVKYVDEYGDETNYVYYTSYLLKKEITQDETTTYSYSNAVITNSVTVDSDGNTINECKYSSGLLIREQDEDEYTYYTYDSKGNMLVCATLKESYTGAPPSVYDSALTCFDTTSYAYDSRGRVTREEYDSGEYNAYTYDSRGNVLSETVAEYQDDDSTQLTTTTTSYTYDSMGNVVSTTVGDDTSAYTYDDDGRLIYSNENGDCTYNRYDANGRLVQTVGPDLFDPSLYSDGTYSDAAAGTTYTYNDKDQLVTENNDIGVVTTYTYYPTGEKHTESFADYEYTYNIEGNVTDIVIRHGSHETHYARYQYSNDGVTPDTDTTIDQSDDSDDTTGQSMSPLQGGKLLSVTYGNGQVVTYTYSGGNLSQQLFSAGDDDPAHLQYKYIYSTDNVLTQKLDFVNRQIYNYTSDDDTGVTTVNVNVMIGEGSDVSNGDLVYSYTETVTDDDDTTDADESAVAATTTVGSSGVTTLSTADGDTITTANGTYTVASTDGEESSSTVLRDEGGSTVLAYTYSYTDDQVTSVTATADNFSNTFGYQYDTEGRITDYSSSNGISDKYTYGNKGQVIRNDHRGIEDGRGNKKTYTFSYDNRGNIRHQKQYDYTTDSLSGEAVNDDLQFSYDYDNDVWLDAVDVMGEGDDAVPIIYDANGNQVEISNVRYHWTNGRQLSAMTYIDDDGAEQPLASYTYDDNGIRTSKTYGDTTTYYTNVDGAITSQYCLDEDGAVTDLMQFIYDGSNDLLGFTYNGATYFYVKNLQGDVIAVIDSAGTEKAVYEYGAYGRLIYSDGDLADVNPMRYRGYYYDSDAGMYYLQSRYYAPEFAKFINSDLPEYAQQQKADHYGTNLFAYCCNDPVNNVDYDGRAKKTQMWVKIADIGVSKTEVYSRMKEMKTKQRSHTIFKKATIYGISQYYSTNRWYCNEVYQIYTYGATRTQWYKLIDNIRAGLKRIGISERIINSNTFAYLASVVLKKSSKKIRLFLTVAGIVMDFLTYILNGVLDKIEKNIRNIDNSKLYVFNLYVLYTCTTLFGSNRIILYAYTPGIAGLL